MSVLWYWVPDACSKVCALPPPSRPELQAWPMSWRATFDRSTQLDSEPLFKPQEGSFSAPLRLRHHDDPLEQALSRRHQRGNTAEDATVLVKKQGRILVDACVIDTIVDATAMLTESLCEQGLAIRYLRQLGKRYRHSFCLIFGSPRQTCLIPYFSLYYRFNVHVSSRQSGSTYNLETLEGTGELLVRVVAHIVDLRDMR